MAISDDNTEGPTDDYDPLTIAVDGKPIEEHDAPFVQASTLAKGHGNYLRVLAAKRTPQIRGESGE